MSNDYPISPSALATAARCGWAHKYYKVQRLRPPSLSPVLLAGTVIHSALEVWAHDRSTSLTAEVRAAWDRETSGTPLAKVVKAYHKLAWEAVQLQIQIHHDRPDIVAITRTKDWKQSDVAKRINKFDHSMKQWLDKDEYDWSDTRFSDVYNQTMVQGQAYEDLYKHHPPALLTELGFTVDVEGIVLRGFIDAVELAVTADGEPCYLVLDYKTYQSEPNPMKDFVQLMTYYLAAEQDLPVWLNDAGYDVLDIPIKVGLDLTYLQERRIYTPTAAHRVQLLDIARSFRAYRDNGVFLPNFKGKCDWCEWSAHCEAQLAWKPEAA